LYNIDRKGISLWREALKRPFLAKLEVPKVVRLFSESVSVSAVIDLNNELKYVKHQLIHEKLRSEELITIIQFRSNEDASHPE